MAKKQAERTRCGWAGSDPLYVEYHDREWGVPVHDDRLLFEFLVLEGAQAGLSWITILRKRENYRRAFDGFEAEKVARYGAAKVRALLGDAGIVRNRLKVESTVGNAAPSSGEEEPSFAAYQWRFVDGTPRQNHRRTLRHPPRSDVSDALSKDSRSGASIRRLDHRLRAHAGGGHGTTTWTAASGRRSARGSPTACARALKSCLELTPLSSPALKRPFQGGERNPPNPRQFLSPLRLLKAVWN